MIYSKTMMGGILRIKVEAIIKVHYERKGSEEGLEKDMEKDKIKIAISFLELGVDDEKIKYTKGLSK